MAVTLNKRLAHNWLGMFSVVLSKSTGRLGSSLNGPLAHQTSVAGTLDAAPFGQNPNNFVNTDGRLIADRPVVVKAQFVYNLPRGFQTSVNFSRQTGRLWSRQVRVPGLGFPGQPTINMEANTGGRRLPDQTSLDVRLQKDFKLGTQPRLSLFADVLNLFNDDAYENIGSRIATSTAFGEPTRFILPRRALIGMRFEF